MNRKDLEKFKEELKRQRFENADSVACEHCGLVTGRTPRMNCPDCGLHVCEYHYAPEDHECVAYDWDAIKEQRRRESDELWINAQKKIQEIRFQKQVGKIATWVILGLVVWILYNFITKSDYKDNYKDTVLNNISAEVCNNFLPSDGVSNETCKSFCIELNSAYSIVSDEKGELCRCCRNSATHRP